MDFLGNWIFWGYLTVLIPFLAFVILYATRSSWRLTRAGQGVMIISGTLTLLLLQTELNLMFGEWPGRDIVRVIVLLGGFVGGWYQLVTLLRAQRDDRLLLSPEEVEQLSTWYTGGIEPPDDADRERWFRENLAHKRRQQ
jgi:hypothetical protein